VLKTSKESLFKLYIARKNLKLLSVLYFCDLQQKIARHIICACNRRHTFKHLSGPRFKAFKTIYKIAIALNYFYLFLSFAMCNKIKKPFFQSHVTSGVQKPSSV
jgi:hypothetical protein